MLAAFFFQQTYADFSVIAARLAHIGAGTVALVAGLIPILGRKGGPLHRRAGRVYVGAMVIVAVTALALTLLLPPTGGRLFLAGIACFSFYLSFSGWRTASRRTERLAPADQVLAGLVLLVGVGMALIGLRTGAVLFGFFGVLTSTFAGRDVLTAVRPAPTRPTPWVFRHISRMGGAYIATLTAVIVVNLGHWLPAGTPSWVNLAGWIAPSIIGGALISRTIRAWKARAH